MSWWKRVWRRLWRRRLVIIRPAEWNRERPDLFLRNLEELRVTFYVKREVLAEVNRETLARTLARDAYETTYKAVMDHGA